MDDGEKVSTSVGAASGPVERAQEQKISEKLKQKSLHVVNSFN